MRRSIIVSVLCSFIFLSACQSSSEISQPAFEPLPDDLVVHSTVDSGPEMVGGPTAMYANLRYPNDARRNRVEGRVLVRIVVDPAGGIRWLGVEESSGNEALDIAALNAFTDLEFTPGILNGEPVYAELFQPVMFRLGILNL